MKIEILEFIDGAKQAKGLTVIIDVFRAFSMACYIMNNGAERIIPVGDLEMAYELKKNNKDYILTGERNEQIQPGFDYGNSPTYIKDIDFTGKTIIQTTGAGTKGIVNAVNADEIITGSFVNINAIINYIKIKNPNMVSLVAMGYRGETRADEDYLCADYIKKSLNNIAVNFNTMYKNIKSGTGSRFFNPNTQKHAPSSDFDLCLNLNAFNFILKVNRSNKNPVYIEKINT